MCTLQLNTSRIHPISIKRDRNLSPSKVVAFLYIGTCLCLEDLTPIHLASYYGFTEVVKKLAKKYPSQVIRNGKTSLHLAALNGHLEIVKFLVVEIIDDTTNLNLGYKWFNGKTPYDLAVENQQFETAKFLLDMSKNPNIIRK